jgi:hypothetical protein
VHTHKLAVHPQFLIGDRDQLDLSSIDATKMVVLKGVDGIYADFASGTKRIFNLIGSQSDLTFTTKKNDVPVDETDSTDSTDTGTDTGTDTTGNGGSTKDRKKRAKDLANVIDLCGLTLFSLALVVF